MEPSRPPVLHFSLDVATARAAQVLATARLNRQVGRRPLFILLQLLVWVGIGALIGAFLAGLEQGQHAPELPAVIFGLLLVSMFAGMAARRLLFNHLGARHAQASGDITLSLEAAGVRSVSGMGEALLPWPRLVEVCEQPGWVAIVLGPMPQVLAVPDAAFADGELRQQWLDALRAGIAGAVEADALVGPGRVEASDGAPAAAPAAAATSSASPATFHRPFNPFAAVRELGRILAFRQPLPGALVADAAGLVFAVLLFAILTLGLQIADNGWQDGELVWYEASKLLSPFAGAALAAALAVLAARRRVEGGRLLIAFALLMLPLPLTALWTGLPVAELMRALDLEMGTWLGWLLLALYYLPQLWLLLAAAVLVWRLVEGGRGLRLAAIAVAVPALATNLWLHAEAPTVWQVTQPEAVAKPRLRIDENVLYGQPRLLERHLAGLQPGQPGVPEIYFLGVGGYGDQDVFLREVRAVEKLFAERYGTAGRSALLVNNVATVHELPVANAESLTVALRQVGARMNRGEDLLFLFMTSHGSRDHRFSLSFWPFRFNDITPQVLRRALDDAGIERRVVVISACYSGGFIPALEDERTLVITAAAADRNSFGCADGNELTDFGRAYFDEALRETRSFTAAFDIARERVAGREQAEGLTPSLPQMSGGAALAPLLAHFEQAPPPAAPPPNPVVVAAPDAYARIALALSPAADDRRPFEICLAAMTENSPAATLARDPDAFNGLERDALHWPRYLGAWERFAGDYCGWLNDHRSVSTLWASAWRGSMPAAQAEALASWLDTPAGQGFRTAFRAALVEETRLVTDHSLRVQRDAEAPLRQVNDDIRKAYAQRAAGEGGQ